MHLRDLTALPVGLMLFFSILFRPVLAAPPVLPFAVVGVDHDAGLSRVAVARHAVGTTETRTARAAPCMRTVLSRFRSPETEKISVVPSGSAVIGMTKPVASLTVAPAGSTALSGSQSNPGLSLYELSNANAYVDSTASTTNASNLNLRAYNNAVFTPSILISGSDFITFTTNSAEAMRITSTGSVGIVSANPASLCTQATAALRDDDRKIVTRIL